MSWPLGKRRRGSIGLEAVLALPAVLLIAGVVAQTMLLAQTRVYVEHAAYAAARSALVHLCNDPGIMDFLTSPYGAVQDYRCDDSQEPWNNAAKWALVKAAPSSHFATQRGGCEDMPAGVELVTGTPMDGQLGTALRNRICYAFQGDNVEVSVEWADDDGWVSQFGAILSPEARPIRATVRFKAALTTPIQRLLSQGVHSDGTPWRLIEATVVLL